jgi:D-tyrosyl-tRNA(Tyr) deacylase
MIALLQRVSEADVRVGEDIVGAIGPGLLALVAVEPDDRESEAQRLLARMLALRIFADSRNRMNLSLSDIKGGLLLVPQFTLLADTSRGNRPGFSGAADPALGAALFKYLVGSAAGLHSPVASGRFGADTAVRLINDGPVTMSLRVAPRT